VVLKREHPMKKLIVGIAEYDEMKARSLAIAKGEYSPKRGEPKVWFTSLESFAKVLSKGNVELLQIIAEHQPVGYKELASLSGRKIPSLSRTLKTMERCGLVSLEKGPDRKIIPHALYSDVELKYPLLAAPGGSTGDRR
jgi:predicted transcriptional regulator